MEFLLVIPGLIFGGGMMYLAWRVVRVGLEEDREQRQREDRSEASQVIEKRPFRVTIPYREPLFDQHKGRPERTYSVDYDVVAENGEEATLKAFDEFFSDSSNSDVGWDRIPDRAKVTVEELIDP